MPSGTPARFDWESQVDQPKPALPPKTPEVNTARDHGEAAMRAARNVLILFGVAILTGTVMMWPITFVCVLVIPFVGLTGVLRGVVSFFAPGRNSFGFGVRVLLATLANGAMLAMGALVAWSSTLGFSRGRQLRRFGAVLLPPVEPGGAWAKLPLTSPDIPASERDALAAQWRENGRTEYASVAAFARLTLDLMALGAPPALIADSNKDALDEIRHAELCFSLARELDGKSESPGAFPAAKSARTLPPIRTLALAALAVDSLVDGALHEGVSARVIAQLAKSCEEPRVRAILKEIAADEGRHAAHGWDVVAWCLAEGGPAVAAALSGALRALPRAMHGDIPADAEYGAWERYGIHGRALESAEFTKTRTDLVARVERMVAPQAVAA